ncbi:MAG: adenylate/guanylate cyclase domain-containing protein [Sneathiella sp.]|uniref:adenylate/guanylate cyclase domain-containing protein n=1 Tax=Sneathiella sp. TaxID=1964365 RepID=UPI0030026754
MTADRILVVDDEPDIEALVTQKFRRQVRKGKMEFIFASDGKHALELLEKEPDVVMVLSDINMPRMDGLTLLEQLNEHHQDLKTVIVSAYGDMVNIRTAMNRGAFDFLTKPIEFDDLEATISKTLDHLKIFRDLRHEKLAAEKAQATLSRYFSPSVVQTLSGNPDCLAPDGERRFATFLFTDLADFTNLVEEMDSDIIVDLLNEYLDQLARIVFEHDGTVMKVVGDALHAIFGAPVEQPDHADRALACALSIDAFATKFRAEKNAQNIPLGDTRIGVNCGQAIIGNFGGDYFFDYTAYGDAVNVAARLESVNKQLGTRICVGQSIVDEATNFIGRPAGTLLLKGKTQSLKTYEPLPQDIYDSPATAGYLKAFDMLEAGAPDARQAFAALVGKFEEDPLTLFHLGRLLAGETGTEISLDVK